MCIRDSYKSTALLERKVFARTVNVPPLKRLNPGLLVVLAAAAAVHFAVAALDFPTLARSFLYDDSFYDFQIARHIAHGEGPTFDGANLTNGFQPLYVAFLVPIYWVAGSSETIPIHAALALSALCTVLTTYLLYRILARRTSETAAIVAAGAWVFSSIVVRQTANGLETSVAVPVSYTHLRAHETPEHLVCRLLL